MRSKTPIDTARRLALAAVVAATAAVPTAATADVQDGPLHGPAGISRSKVLVIGTDGTRWDQVQRMIAAGRAPNLQALIARGFGTPTLLQYQPPQAFTMSAVGWSTISSGVWPAKHGVVGLFNNDPQQADKNGYADFLTRLERIDPRFSTFSVSDWGNLGLHQSGGPIFSDAVDVKHATAVADSIPAYEAGDQQDADVAADYLRNGDPDAGFVYLGLVDETGHAVGTTGPQYPDAIERTDRRIGQLLAAIEARPSRASEQWTVIVTTDHGQQDLPFGSPLIHGFGSDLERTSFVVAAGPGVPSSATPDGVHVVDVAPTVLHQLRVAPDPAWGLDGRSFVTAAVPPDPRPQPTAPAPPAATVVPAPTATGRLRGAGSRWTLAVTAGRSAGGPALRSLRVTLPRGLAAAGGRRAVRARADGRGLAARTTARTIRLTSSSATAGRLSVRVPAGRLRVTGAARVALRHGRSLVVRLAVVDANGRTTPLTLRLRGSR